MVQKITGEAPFQVLATNFSISPSQQDYTLQISADGTNYSDLFTVSAGQTKMVTNVANGSYYRMKNNASEVSINWRTQCNDGQGGGGGSYILPPATQQTLGGVKVGNGLTVQADGTLSANGGGSEPYKIELSSYDPQYFTTGDTAALNAFYAAVAEDPSIGDGAYIKCGDYIFNMVEYGNLGEGFGEFKFVMTNSESIKELRLHFEDNEYNEGFLWENNFNSLYTTSEFPEFADAGQIVNFDDGETMGLFVFNGEDWVPFGGGEGGDNTILKAVSEAPETLEKGDVYALNAPFEAPESPDGQTVYGGNITDFKATVEDNNNQIWVNTWDDAQHTETTNQGYFELDKNGDLAFYDYQGDYYYILMDYYDRKGEWIQCNGVYIRWEGENLYFYVNQESNGVYFNPDVDMNFDSVGSTIGVYQANFKTLPNVKIEVDGDAHIDGTAEAPEQVVTNYNGHMLVSFNDLSTADGKVCELESYGNYYPLVYDDANDRWTLYDSDGETALIEVGDGQSRSAQFDGSATAYLSYSGGVLTANTSEEKGWKNWEMGDGGTVLDPEELAKVSQIPAENRLVPTGGAYGQYLWTDGTNTSWNNAPSPEQYWGYPYEDGTAPVYSTSTWSTQWRKVVQSQDVKNIVKITVSDYETLVQNQQTDPNTLYLTYEPQV